jgi:hypothetical protein
MQTRQSEAAKFTNGFDIAGVKYDWKALARSYRQ